MVGETATKRYDCYTKLDDNNGMVGHFCLGGDCFHCKDGVPFMNPPIELLGQLSDAALSVLRRENETRLVQAQMAVRAIENEQRERGVAG